MIHKNCYVACLESLDCSLFNVTNRTIVDFGLHCFYRFAVLSQACGVYNPGVH